MKAFFEWLNLHPYVRVYFEKKQFRRHGEIDITMIGKKYRVGHAIDECWLFEDEYIFKVLEHLYRELCNLEIVVDKSVEKVGTEE